MTIFKSAFLLASASIALSLVTASPSSAAAGLVGTATGEVYACANGGGFTDCAGAFGQHLPPGGAGSFSGVTDLGSFTTTDIDFFIPDTAHNTIGYFLTHDASNASTATTNTSLLSSATLNRQFSPGPSFSTTVGGTFIVLTGQIFLNAGANTLTLPHDDGIILSIAGIGVYDDHAPTSVVPGQSHTFNAPSAGLYSFTLEYAGVNGPPERLELSQAPGPIPGAGLLSYIALALLGLGSAAWKRLRPQVVPA
jgi:hypothetical protein